MLEEKQIICINCPMGCRMTVGIEGGKVVSVQGNTCKRGEEFAYQEAIEPMRILTSLMRVEGREKPFSVKTSSPIPKKVLFQCARQIADNPVDRKRLPIHIGDVMIADVCGSGADIISTQEVEIQG